MTTRGGMDRSTWAPLFEDAGEAHVALIYRDQGFLARAVALWCAPALRAGGGAILVGTTAHAMSIRQELGAEGIDVAGAERVARLVFVDADWLMGHFILDGTPDAQKFRALASDMIRGVRAKGQPLAPVRAWGEMVSLLRLRGKPLAAQQLEELWAQVIADHDIALLCSYDAAHGESAETRAMSEIAHSHGKVILQPELELEAAATRA